MAIYPLSIVSFKNITWPSGFFADDGICPRLCPIVHRLYILSLNPPHHICLVEYGYIM